MEDDFGDNLSDVKGSFRYTSQWVFLTYAQANELDRADILRGLEQLGYYKIFGGQELHQDGGRHFHVIAQQAKKKVDIRNARYWDIGGVHPNVRHVKNFDRIWTYCSKDGDTFGVGNLDPLLAKGSFQGFRARKADLEEFKSYVADKGKRSPFPFDLPFKKTDTITIGVPQPSDRQRCLYITGRANTGKTRYFTNILAGSSVYYGADGDLEFDGYCRELLILYDDRVPPLPSLISALNYTEESTPCPGRQRYYRRSFLPRQARFVIIIGNLLKPWMPGCTNSKSCDCPGCTRCIYFNWDLHYEDPMIAAQPRLDYSS